jgi:hypothetical protein
MEQELIMLVFNSSIEDEVMDTLKAAGLVCYTRIPCVQGVGEDSEPRLDSHVWPGTNTMLMICAGKELRENLLSAIRQIKERHADEGVKAIILPVIDCV